MACDELDANLGQDARPSGSVTMGERPIASTFCRSFTFVPPVVQGIVTFLGDDMATFAGDTLVTF